MTQPRSEPAVRASRLERLVGLLKLQALILAREDFDAASDRATDAWGWRYDMQDRAAHQWPLPERTAVAREEMAAAVRHLEAFANYKRPFKAFNDRGVGPDAALCGRSHTTDGLAGTGDKL